MCGIGASSLPGLKPQPVTQPAVQRISREVILKTQGVDARKVLTVVLVQSKCSAVISCLPHLVQLPPRSPSGGCLL